MEAFLQLQSGGSADIASIAAAAAPATPAPALQPPLLWRPRRPRHCRHQHYAAGAAAAACTAGAGAGPEPARPAGPAGRQPDRVGPAQLHLCLPASVSQIYTQLWSAVAGSISSSSEFGIMALIVLVIVGFRCYCHCWTIVVVDHC